MNYKNKCKYCANSDSKFFCKEQNQPCKDCFINCSDKRVCCKLCNNYNLKENECLIDGHFKDENTFRTCVNFNFKRCIN